MKISGIKKAIPRIEKYNRFNVKRNIGSAIADKFTVGGIK